MTRRRISTTVDADLLERARRSRSDSPDSQLIDEALVALLERDRSAMIDAAYERAYRDHPMDEPDEWGDLGSFREAGSR